MFNKTSKLAASALAAILFVGALAGCNYRGKGAQPAPTPAPTPGHTAQQQAAAPTPTPGHTTQQQAAAPTPTPGHTMQQRAASPAPSPGHESRIRVANEAASKIVNVSGVKSANVLVTQNNAYVAAVMKEPAGQLTKDAENQISQQVKAVDPNVHNVYVSTNPDFVQRVNNYVADVGAGRPVSGFAAEFGEMVRRVFPKAR